MTGAYTPLIPVTPDDRAAVKKFHTEQARRLVNDIKHGTHTLDAKGDDGDTIYQAFAEHRRVPVWIRRETGDNDQLPTVEGHYRVKVTGDSESIDGHTLYDFPDYETWAYFTPDEEGGNFRCDHDEDKDFIFAYCGPFHVPTFENG